MVDVALLGSVSITVDGAALYGEAAQRRRVALLTLLVAPELRPVSRDRLIGLIWPDNSPDSARHLLSAALHVLRKALGQDVLLTTGDDVSLNPAAVRADVPAFREAVAAGDVERALSLYRGEFLEGFFVNDAADFSDWVDAERAELKRLYGDALERAAALRSASGDAAGAAAAWRKRAALDPYDARVAVGLMRALAAAGQRTAAVQHARLHAQLLEQEFEAAPDPQVEALARELLQHPPEPIAPPPGGSAPAPAAPTSPSPPAAATVEYQAAAPAQATPSPPAVGPPPAARPAARRPGPGLLARLVPPVLVGTVLVTVLQLASARNEPLVIGVRPLEPDPPDSVLAALGRGLARDITAELTRIEGVQVVVSDVAFETIGLETRQAIEQMGIATHALNLLLHRSPRGYATHVELADRQGRLVIDPQAAGEVTGSTLVDMKHAVLSGLARGLDRELRPESASQRAGDAADSGAVRLATLAKEAWFERTPASLRRALAYFDSAIALDSAYAAAWAGRANALNMLGSYDYSGMAPAAAFDSAEHAARRALALDPERADAYAALGLAQANYRWNWDEAEDNYLKALGRGGSDTSAREWYAQFLAARGRFEEAIQQTRAAVQQLPSLPLPRVNLAHVLYYAGAYDSARAGVQQVLERDPGYNRAHVLAALIDLAAGLRLAGAEGRQLEQGALARLEAMRAASPDPEPVLTALLGYARARCGDRAGARTQLQALERAEREVYVSPELKLLVHVGLGEHDAAFEQLERALEIRSSGLIYMNVEPLIAPLRKDPRFAALAAQVH